MFFSKKVIVDSFVSKAFNDQERKWSTIEQEAFAIFYGVKQLNHFLLGQKFTVETDHKNLIYFYKSTTPKVVRWRLTLMEYDFDVVHILGKDNTLADALSRVLVVGKSVRNEIEKFHNCIVEHFGVNTTVKLLKSNGHNWKSIKADVLEFVTNCATY